MTGSSYRHYTHGVNGPVYSARFCSYTFNARNHNVVCHPQSGTTKFFNELNALAAQSDGHLPIIWVVSEAEAHAINGEGYHFKGHISGELLQAILPTDDYEFYLCGASGFMQSMYDISIALGVSDSRIMAESFGPASL
jgi:ferredoxin-NADP reductase